MPLDNPSEAYILDPSAGWFPHEVGNYWINEDYIPCNDRNKEWYWEVVDIVETDTANYFQLEKHLNPCDTTQYYIYTQWYSYTDDNKLFMTNEDFEHTSIEADFNLEVGESYFEQWLRYTVIEKSENRIVFEYDLYDDGTYTRRWIRGLGRDMQWDKIKISGIEYTIDH
jgi:hypothetical protein